MKSMTGFGRGVCLTRQGQATVEVRTLNHRFRNVRLNLPEGCASLEPKMERFLRERLRRGSVTVTLSLEAAGGAPAADMEKHLQALHRRLAKVKRRLGYREPLEFEELLECPLAWDGAKSSTALSWREIAPAMREAMRQVVNSRRKEGASILRSLRSCAATMQRRISELRVRAAGMPERYRQKILDRLRALVPEMERPAREALLREVLGMVERCDVSEEISRLEHHMRGFRKALAAKGPVGRRLEFLTQELLRETNTIAAKSEEAPVIDACVALKQEIERVKELVENAE